MTPPLDPRVQAANIRAAARQLAEAAATLEMIETQMDALSHTPPSAAKLYRVLTLRFRCSSAERSLRSAVREARRAGLEERREYPAEVDGVPCRVLIDGPSVLLLSS